MSEDHTETDADEPAGLDREASTAPDANRAEFTDPHVGQRIGNFSIKSVIGTGGMGTVYLAVQESPRRKVALKVMKRGIASRSALRRFEFESQILGRLRHPNVAQVYEAGTHDDGSGSVPYFVMEYIANAKTLIEYAQAKALSTRERLALFAKVCDAVHHGHQKGIIHRDLKPGNIVVDSSGAPKIIDFGVARATDSDLAVTTIQTDIGQFIGTLQYMSPEQCEAEPDDLDTRSDVYALGVVLYELLTDQLPYDLSRAAIHEAARIIREDAPTRPSTIKRTLRGDVETITLKAMEKDREQRYRSAIEISTDIRRYIDGDPIGARPPSVAYVLSRFLRRNRWQAAALIGLPLAVIFLLGILGMGVLYASANHHRDEAMIAKDEAELRLEMLLAAQAAEAEAVSARNAAISLAADVTPGIDDEQFRRVSAILVYTLAKYVRWPTERVENENSPFIVCVLDDMGLAEALTRAVEARPALQGRSVLVRAATSNESIEIVREAHLVFIPASLDNDIEQIISGLAGASTLTVSNLRGFTVRGGMIELFLDGDKIRYALNRRNMELARLRPTSKILEYMAEIDY